MKKELLKILSLDNHIGCFGRFNLNDPICKRFCALSLRCSIEYEDNTRMEIIDELVSSDSVFIKMQ